MAKLLDGVAMTIDTHKEYTALLHQWAARTRSEPLDSWRGPGEYKPTGFYSDEWRPTATLERRPVPSGRR